jgi:uncharacterized protein
MVEDQAVSSYEILIEGKELWKHPGDAAKSIIEVMVLQDVSAPAMFAVRLTNGDKSQGNVTWSDEDMFELGKKVEILMGPEGKRRTVIFGEVTGLEPDFRGGQPMTVTVRGYDLSHRLMRGRNTRTWVSTKDSEIANELAKKVGLEPRVGETEDTLEYVMQHNQTDLEFLQARAGRLGYKVMVEGKDLKFRRYWDDTSTVLLLNKSDLKEFYPRLSTIGLAGKVVVQGWSAKDKEVITGEASADAVKTMGDKSGLAVADKAFKAAQDVLVDQPVQSQAEARRIALGRLSEMALTYITGHGVATLKPALKAGAVVNIDGCGTRFSGLYYLTTVRHTCSSNGYHTAFTVQRNAAS